MFDQVCFLLSLSDLNLNIYKPQRASSHSPSHKPNIIINKSKLTNPLKNDNKNGLIINAKTSNYFKNKNTLNLSKIFCIGFLFNLENIQIN